jgi:hypothetical protein
MEETEKKTKTFLVEAPVEVEEKLRLEAIDKRRSRNAQLVRILEERYNLISDSETAQPAEVAA